MTAGDIMNASAALLNDTAKTLFDFTVQLPYLKVAYQELQEELENNDIPMVSETSAVIPLATGVTSIAAGVYPADLIEPKTLYERLTGSLQDFAFMTPVEFLPPFATQVQSLIYWTWQAQTFKFLGATTPRDIKINYLGATLTPIVDQSTVINLINAGTFLNYRTASLCAQWIGENKERADDLNINARIALDRLLNINVKGKQSISTRHRPFMAAYKVRGGF